MTRILLVEDRAGAILLQEALRAADVSSPVDHVTRREQAIATCARRTRRPACCSSI